MLPAGYEDDRQAGYAATRWSAPLSCTRGEGRC